MEQTLAEAREHATLGSGSRRLPRGPRHDLYALIHKALRLAMTDVLGRVGRLDTGDDDDVRTVALAVRELLGLCRMHLDKEEKFVHPALEAAVPGGAGRTAREHDDHLRAFDRLETGVRALERSAGAARAAAGARLYRDAALFVAENFIHMHGEEADNNAVLWASYDDDEIAAIERRIVGSIAAEQMLGVLRWMAPAMTPAERGTFFAQLRGRLPPPAFAGVMNEVLGTLDPAAKQKLLRSLAC
jgi:hypothetical protein